MILNIIVTVIILSLMGWFCYFNYKKCKDDLEKSLYILLFCVSATPIIIYYLDRYNVPTLLGWNINVNSQNWLNFFATYSSSIVSAIISAYVLIMVTMLQIKKNNEDNLKRDFENMRIQNMPIIKYDLNACDFMLTKTEIKTKYEENNKYVLNINLKNIGLNAVKSIKVDFDSEINNNKILHLLGRNTQISLEKTEQLSINKCFNLKYSDNSYNMQLILYYQDMLNNWYKQVIEIEYSTTDQSTVGGYIGKVTYIVNTEALIDKENIK